MGIEYSKEGQTQKGMASRKRVKTYIRVNISLYSTKSNNVKLILEKLYLNILIVETNQFIFV